MVDSTETETHLVFVYGSLLSGDKSLFHNNHIMTNYKTEKVCDAKTELPNFTMVSNQAFSYPFVLHAKDTREGCTATCITGEVHRVSSEARERLDRLEMHPHWYLRQAVSVVPQGENGSQDSMEVDIYILEDKANYLMIL